MSPRSTTARMVGLAFGLALGLVLVLGAMRPTHARAWWFEEHLWIGEGAFLHACAELTREAREARAAGFRNTRLDEEAAYRIEALICSPTPARLGCEDARCLRDPTPALEPVLSARKFGQATAIAGDYMDSPAGFELVEARGNAVALVAYGERALTDGHHFHPRVMIEWAEYHEAALKLAADSPTARSVELRSHLRHVLYTEAFASHFLQDAFATGHMGFNRGASRPIAAKTFHDQWSKDGRWLRNRDGEQWFGYGDSRLFEEELTVPFMLDMVWGVLCPDDERPASQAQAQAQAQAQTQTRTQTQTQASPAVVVPSGKSEDDRSRARCRQRRALLQAKHAAAHDMGPTGFRGRVLRATAASLHDVLLTFATRARDPRAATRVLDQAPSSFSAQSEFELERIEWIPVDALHRAPRARPYLGLGAGSLWADRVLDVSAQAIIDYTLLVQLFDPTFDSPFLLQFGFELGVHDVREDRGLALGAGVDLGGQALQWYGSAFTIDLLGGAVVRDRGGDGSVALRGTGRLNFELGDWALAFAVRPELAWAPDTGEVNPGLTFSLETWIVPLLGSNGETFSGFD